MGVFSADKRAISKVTPGHLPYKPLQYPSIASGDIRWYCVALCAVVTWGALFPDRVETTYTAEA